MGHWDSGQVFPRFRRDDRFSFPGPSLQIPKCVTNYKALHVNTPFRVRIVRFSSKVVDSTQKGCMQGK